MARRCFVLSVKQYQFSIFLRYMACRWFPVFTHSPSVHLGCLSCYGLSMWSQSGCNFEIRALWGSHHLPHDALFLSCPRHFCCPCIFLKLQGHRQRDWKWMGYLLESVLEGFISLSKEVHFLPQWHSKQNNILLQTVS